MIIIFPMTGPLFFEGKEFHYPKPLIELHGKTLIEHAIDEFLDIPNVEFRFVLKQDDDDRFQLSSVIQQAVKGRPVKIITVPGKTSGALCSALMALPENDKNKEEEVIISNYDQKFNIQLKLLLGEFRKNQPDFGLVSFDSIHPKWSYVRLDSDNVVCEASEKKPISRHALCGLYYFKSKMTLVSAILNILKTASANQETFYVSEVINQLVLMGKRGEVEKISRNGYINFYEPNIVLEYLSKVSHKTDKVTGLTKSYVNAFHLRDVDRVLEHFSEDALLSDPLVELSGKKEIQHFLEDFFHTNKEISFASKSIHASDSSSIIHFELTIGKKIFEGTDVIQWADGKITKLQAYLTQVANEKS